MARELLLTGDPIDADRAERLGFVNRLVGPGEAVEEAVALAQRICRNGPVGIRETMRVLDGLVADDDVRAWELTREAEAVDLRRRRHQGGRLGLLRAPRTPLDRPLTHRHDGSGVTRFRRSPGRDH